MKTLTIFRNNLRTISRNWIYFVILIICPIVLILLSGVILNSADYNNIKVGIINEDQSKSFDDSFFKNKEVFSSLSECIEAVSASRANICIHYYETEEKHSIDVYVDNRKKLVDFYSRQYILEKFSQEKLDFFEQSSKDFSQRLSVFSSSINDSKTELYLAYYELEDQEKTLQEYRVKLAETRATFDELSTSLKEIQPEISRMKNDLNSETNSISGNLSLIKKQKDLIENNIYILETFLSLKLTSNDYYYVVEVLDSSLKNLEELEKSLEAINETYSDPGFVRAVNNLDSAIGQIDSIQKTLNEIDSEMENSIENTKKSKENIDHLIQNLNDGEFRIAEMKNQLEGKGTYLEFQSAFIFSTDPILLSFPLLISIIIVFTSIVLSNLFILKQTGAKSYEREILTPTSDRSFFVAGYLTNIFFIFIQIVALFLIGYYLFSGIIFDNIGLIFLAIFLATSIFVFIGMIIGYLVRTQSLSMLLAIFLVILFLVFSDILAPTEIAGPIIKFLLVLNPFIVINAILFDIIVVKVNLVTLVPEFVKLGAIAFVLLVVAFISKIVSKNRLIQ